MLGVVGADEPAVDVVGELSVGDGCGCAAGAGALKDGDGAGLIPPAGERPAAALSPATAAGVTGP
ncbi:MAG: hypothetical protein ACPGVY_08180 [Mycobacterium sp.]